MEEEKAFAGQERAREFIEAARRQYQEMLESEVLSRCPDGILLRMYLEKDVSFRELARVTGLEARTIGNRVRRVTKRLRAWRYAQISGRLGPEDMAIAWSFAVLGLTMGEIARERGMTRHRVRKLISKIRAVTGFKLVNRSGRARKGRNK